MNKNQNFIPFTPADQHTSKAFQYEQITEKIWVKRKTTSRPKFEQNLSVCVCVCVCERERERA